MNTPRSRPLRRYSVEMDDTPDGEYTAGIEQEKMAAAVGYLITVWPHIEEHMVDVFAELIGATDKHDARLIFRTIINQKARLDIMRSMLEGSPRHKEKDGELEEIIAEYSALNTRRNKYAHGLWWTYQDGARFFLEEETDTYLAVSFRSARWRSMKLKR